MLDHEDMIFLILCFSIFADDSCYRDPKTGRCHDDTSSSSRRSTPIAPAKAPPTSCFESHPVEWGITFTNLRTRWAVVVANCQEKPGGTTSVRSGFASSACASSGSGIKSDYCSFTEQFKNYFTGVERSLGEQLRKKKAQSSLESKYQNSFGTNETSGDAAQYGGSGLALQPESYAMISNYSQYQVEKTYDEYDELHRLATNGYCQYYMPEFKTAMSLQTKEDLEKYIEGCTVACGGKDCYGSGASSSTPLAAPKSTPARTSHARSRGSGAAVRPTVRTARATSPRTASSPAPRTASATPPPAAAAKTNLGGGSVPVPSAASINESSVPVPRPAPELTTPVANTPVEKPQAPKSPILKADAAPAAPKETAPFNGIAVLELANSQPPQIKPSTRYYKKCDNAKLLESTNYVYKVSEINAYVENCQTPQENERFETLMLNQNLDSFKNAWRDNAASSNSNTHKEVGELLAKQVQKNKAVCKDIKDKYEAAITALQVAARSQVPGQREALLHGLACPNN